MLEALESAIAALAGESDPTQITRIGTAACCVDRVEGCRDALWRVVHDARRGGAVAPGIIALIELAYDDLESGHWDESEALVEEGIQKCVAHGYQSLIWPCRFVQAFVAAARGDDSRANELTDELVQWTGPRGMRMGYWYTWQVRGLAALGQGATRSGRCRGSSSRAIRPMLTSVSLRSWQRGR